MPNLRQGPLGLREMWCDKLWMGVLVGKKKMYEPVVFRRLIVVNWSVLTCSLSELRLRTLSQLFNATALLKVEFDPAKTGV